MGAVTHYPCTFHRGGRHAGTTIFTYSCHASVPSVYRRKERLETLSAICAIYRSIFRFGVTIGHFITVQSSYEPRYGDRCAWFDSSRKLASRRDGSAYKDELRRQPMVEGVTVAANSVLGEYWTRGLINNEGKRITTLNFNYCHYNYPEVMGIK